METVAPLLPDVVAESNDNTWIQPCPKCGQPATCRLRPDTKHYAELRCKDCGHRWLPAPGEPPVKTIVNPFTVLVDTREQQPFEFVDLWTGPKGRSKLIQVPTERATLKTGDYGIRDYPKITIERKSVSDLYQSVSQERENFIGRLERMCMNYHSAFIVVEGQLSDVIAPQPYTKYAPKSMSRTLQAWMIRYAGVHWIFAQSRAHAAVLTFRLLERYWKDQQSERAELAAGRGWGTELVRRWDAELVAEIDAEEQAG